MLQGYLDQAQRAIVRIELTSPKAATLRLEIDTGSQPQICIHEDLADQLGVVMSKGHRATFADGKSRTVFAGAATVNWFGNPLDVEVLVWPRGKSPAAAPTSGQGRNRNVPDGLLGRSLLNSTALSIDYVNRRVEISMPASQGA